MRKVFKKRKTTIIASLLILAGFFTISASCCANVFMSSKMSVKESKAHGVNCNSASLNNGNVNNDCANKLSAVFYTIPTAVNLVLKIIMALIIFLYFSTAAKQTAYQPWQKKRRQSALYLLFINIIELLSGGILNPKIY